MVGFMLDETRERFYIDSNRNGDLTDELPSSWMVERKPVGDGAKTSGQVTVREEIATSAAPDAGRWSVALFFHDRATREEFTIDFSIDRYRDYATEGHLKLGDCYYRILLDDGAVTGDFAHSTTAPRMELELNIDVNGNGLYEHRGESFSVNEPFTIAGTTYEVTRISRDGTEIELARSAKTVPEILPPPDLRPGATAPSFVTTSVDGKPISFPGDFAGKIVLLDFWAAWCGPCLREFPHLTEAYREYHQRGFEILSVSIDEEKTRAKAEAIIKEKSLTWHQSFDTGGWNGLIISRFCPGGIPAGYLVDGDTGKIIASLNQVRGPALRAAIEQGLTAQGR
jgi:thiol-disulfide isomerase/thioredoxin